MISFWPAGGQLLTFVNGKQIAGVAIDEGSGEVIPTSPTPVVKSESPSLNVPAQIALWVDGASGVLDVFNAGDFSGVIPLLAPPDNDLIFFPANELAFVPADDLMFA